MNSTRLLACICVVCVVIAILLPVSVKADAGGGTHLRPVDVDGRLEHVLARGRLIVGVKTDYPPWGMFDQDGRIVGLEADLARDLGSRLGLPVDLLPVTAANRLTRLSQGHVDIVIATLGDTAVRRRVVDLIRPHYYSSGIRLLVPDSLSLEEWDQIEGHRICLTEGAYFNSELARRFLIEPLTFPGTRDTGLALRGGRCTGWAYDETALSQLLGDPEWEGYQLSLPAQMESLWAIAVALGEGDRSLGRFVADSVAHWHRSGWLLERQNYWGIPPTGFLQAQHERFIAKDDQGAWICRRGDDGLMPEDCLETVPLLSGTPPQLAGWAESLKHSVGLDLTALFDAMNRQRLVTGIVTTLLLSVTAILGSMVVGVALALIERKGDRGTGYWLLRQPAGLLVTLARMTPPLLQLYIVFFGVSGLLATHLGITLSGFVVAGLVFSIYAGASNAAILGPSLARQERADPHASLPVLVRRSIEQSFEGLMAVMVNIVKAAGMASTIAVPEVISAVHLLISEGGDAVSLMTMLVVFYFCFVVVVMALLDLLRRWATP